MATRTARKVQGKKQSTSAKRASVQKGTATSLEKAAKQVAKTPSRKAQTRPPGRWSEQQAWAWQKKMGWLVGCNFNPRNAINQLEFWQADTFSPDVIDEELGWAESLGYNSVRVFLHNLLWEDDADGFYDRLDQFLTIADRHGIGTMFVLFDSCWDPNPQSGKQREPKPGVHNSGWMQAPGMDVLRNPEKFLPLRGYVEGVIGRFADDPRVQIWDLWNEPDNNNFASYGPNDVTNKCDVILPFLIKTFAWARNARPSQPLTGGPWIGEWASDDQLSPTNHFLLRESDVITFHCYGDAQHTQDRLLPLKRFNRPLLCTEYMARGVGSTFQACLPVLKKHQIGAYQWGFVQGKTQTHIPWDSWQKPYTDGEPPLWFHEVFRSDGAPYRPEEVRVIKRLTQDAKRHHVSRRQKKLRR